MDARCAPSAPRATLAGRSRSTRMKDSYGRARRQAETPEYPAVYRRHRPMVERSIAWLTRADRRVRYRCVRKSDHWLHNRGAALNLRRLLVLGLGRINGPGSLQQPEAGPGRPDPGMRPCGPNPGTSGRAMRQPRYATRSSAIPTKKLPRHGIPTRATQPIPIFRISRLFRSLLS